MNHEACDQALFDRIAKRYCAKDLRAAPRRARQERLWRTLDILPSAKLGRVLEVGCGAGFSARYLENRYDIFVGVDYSKELVDIARERNAVEGASFVAQNIKDYRPEHLFDTVIMIGVLHHFDDVGSTLKHICGFLRPGGWLVANEPQASNVIIQMLRRARTKLDPSYSADQLQFTPTQIRTCFERAGLISISVFPQGLLSTPFAEKAMWPDRFFLPLAHGACMCDRYLETRLSCRLLPWSWNVVACGKKL